MLLACYLSTTTINQTLASEEPLVIKDNWNGSFFTLNCPGQKHPKQQPSNTELELNFEADDIKNPSPSEVTFKGNVELQQGNKRLSADQAYLNKKNNTFKALGNIRYQDQQIRFASDAITLNVEQQTAQIQQAEFQFVGGALRGKSSDINVISGQQLNMSNVHITSCPIDDESWSLQTDFVEVYADEGIAEAKDVILKVNDVPVFYFPYISFPVDDRRMSGFLYPSIGTSSRNGLEIETPWYWNIAEDKDATFAARYLSKRGLMLGGEYRQLTEHTDTEIYAEYLPNDSRGLPGSENRSFYNINSNYSEGEHWRGLVDVSSVSDDDYFYDFGGNYNSGNRNFLKRYATLSFDNEHLSFRGLVSNDQLLSTPEDPYSRLPQLSLSLLYPEVYAGLTTNLHMEATAFRHDTNVDAERLFIVPEINMPLYWLSGYIKPNLKLHYSHYSQDDPVNLVAESVDRTVPIFSIDSAMFFDRELKIANQGFIQSLEPRLFYLYVPSKDQSDIALFDTNSVNNGVDSLFRENRYSGFDRIGDSNQISLAVTSRFFEQASGRERLSVTLGRAYYLEDRTVNLVLSGDGSQVIDLGIDSRANSALITNLQVSIYDDWKLEGELEYDDSQSRTEKGVLGLHYLSSGLSVNLQHRMKRYANADNVEQAEVSLAWQASNEWSFVGKWKQDLIKNRTIDSFVGLEYEGCCWAVRLVARKYLNIRLDREGFRVAGSDEFNKGIYLEFILKGLTNIGNSLNLTRDIQGYEDRFNNY